MFRSTNWSDSSTPPSFGGNFSPITEEKNELRSPVDDEQVNILPGPHESGRTRSCHVAVVFVHCRGAGSDRVHTNCWKTWFAMEGFVTKSARGAGFPAGTSPGQTVNTHGLPGASHRFPNAEIGRSRFLFVTGAQEISEAFARKRSARSGQLPRVNSIVINFNFAIEQERRSAGRPSEFFHLVDDSRGRVHRVRRVLDYFQNFSFTIRDAVGGGIVSTQG